MEPVKRTPAYRLNRRIADRLFRGPQATLTWWEKLTEYHNPSQPEFLMSVGGIFHR
jgi:hypothetical protein